MKMKMKMEIELGNDGASSTDRGTVIHMNQVCS